MANQPHSPILDQNRSSEGVEASRSSPILEQSQNSQGITSTMEFSTLTKSLNYNLPIKLSRSNYLYWKTLVLPSIQALDLEDFLCGLNEPQIVHENVEITNHLGEKIVEKRMTKEYSCWKRVDKLLMGWIYSTISENLIGHVVGCKSSFEVWNRLERLYSQQSMAKVAQLKNQLQACKKGSDSIGDFVLKIKNFGDALMAAGEDVKDRDLVLTLINGVGHDFDSIVAVISTQQRFISLEDAQYLLMMHEQRLEHLDSSTYVGVSQASANYVTNNFQERKGQGQRDGGSYNNRGGFRGRGRNGKPGGRGRLHCQVCNKPGHSALKCYYRFDQGYQGPPQYQQQYQQQNQQQNQAFFNQQQGFNNQQGFNGQMLLGSSPQINTSATMTEPQANFHQTSAYLATPESVNDPAWYVDSGATNHITSDLNNLSLRSSYRGSPYEENFTSRGS